MKQLYCLEVYSDEVDLSQFDISMTAAENGSPIILTNNRTRYYYLYANEPETHTYIIKISYNGDLSTNIEGNINIRANSYQIKP